MNVGELKDILEGLDEELEVTIRPSNSRYLDNIKKVSIEEMRAYWERNKKVLILTGKEQVGAT